MVMSFELSVDGFDEVIKRLVGMGEVGESTINEALSEGAKIIMEEAKRLVIDETGELQKSIRLTKPYINEGGEFSIGIKVGSKKAYYYYFVHEGHDTKDESKVIMQNPFMLTAYERKSNQAIQRIKQILMRGMER